MMILEGLKYIEKELICLKFEVLCLDLIECCKILI